MELAISCAHLTASLGRMKRMPPLERLLGTSSEPRIATKAKPWQQQLAGWERFLGKSKN